MTTIAARTLVTGFTGFGRFAENPAATLAAGCCRLFALIEVSYAAADEFVASLDSSAFDRLLMLGVAGSADAMRVERVARNRVGPTPDVRGSAPAIGPIDSDAPPTLAATLWPDAPPAAGAVFSDDAGDYLCNYLMFRALQRMPGTRVGFLHVPPVESMPLARQTSMLAAVLAWAEAGPDSAPPSG